MARGDRHGDESQLPVRWAQLNSVGGSAANYKNPKIAVNKLGGDPLGAWVQGFPSLRIAQTNTLGLPNTFQAVILDTPVASGSIHSPYKQPVGSRLARGGLRVIYNISSPTNPDPVVLSATRDGTTVTITLGGLGE